jgi:hypothetical protein
MITEYFNAALPYLLQYKNIIFSIELIFRVPTLKTLTYTTSRDDRLRI